MPERIVVDSSFLIEAVLPTSQQWQTEALYLINAVAIGDIAMVCPHLLFLEIAAVCAKKIKPVAAARIRPARQPGHRHRCQPVHRARLLRLRQGREMPGV